MKKVTLERFCYSDDMGVFGKLRIGNFECFTVERPWKNNEPNVSCIPTDAYELKLGRFWEGDYATYELLDVPNRSLIKIHRGNTMDDLKGCIALGNRFGMLRKDKGGQQRWAVLNSLETHRLFMKAMDGVQQAILVVRNIKELG